MRSVKNLSFGQKLPIWAVHYTFLESKHPDVTKNPYYVLAPKGSQNKVSAHILIIPPPFASRSDRNGVLKPEIYKQYASPTSVMYLILSSINLK